MWYSLLVTAGPIVLGFGVAWCIAPEKTELLFSGATLHITSSPAEAIFCCVMLLGVFAFWPRRKDEEKLYFRDVKEGCYHYSKIKLCCMDDFNYSEECCERKCPELRHLRREQPTLKEKQES
jgi:hypothetical protein